jgi:hypothetical protein
VNYYALNWAVVAVSRNFTAYVIDYGQYPKGDVLWEAGRNETAEKAIYKGISELSQALCMRHPHLGEIIFDGNYATDTVYQAVRSINQRKHLDARLMVGRGVSSQKYSLPNSTASLINEGYECHLSESKVRGRHIIFNSHYWHMHMQKGFLIDTGFAGSVSLFGDKNTDHRVVANHICADKLIDVEFKNGKEIYTFADCKEHNDLGDAIKMGLVGASVYGADVNSIDKPKVEEVKIPQQRVKHINL